MGVRGHDIRDFYFESLETGEIETYSKLIDIFLLHSRVEDINNYIIIRFLISKFNVYVR